MKPEDIKEDSRYYRHGGQEVAHVVHDTFPGKDGWEMIYTFCRSTFNYGKDHSNNAWGSKEKVVVDGISLCEKCEKAFQEQPTLTDSVSKGVNLLREYLKEK